MTEMWDTRALEWRCRECFSGFRLMILQHAKYSIKPGGIKGYVRIMTEMWDAGAFQWRCRAWLSASYKIRLDLIKIKMLLTKILIISPSHNWSFVAAIHSSTSWQRYETQVHFNDVVAHDFLHRMYVCMYVCMYVDGLMSCSEDHVHVCMYVVVLRINVRLSTHQHHGRDVRRRCISMTLSRRRQRSMAVGRIHVCMYVCVYVPDLWWCMIGVRFSVDTQLTNITTGMWDACAFEWPCRDLLGNRSHAMPRLRGNSMDFFCAHLTHRYCNPLIDIMTEMWNTCALEWRCRERFSGFRLMILVLTMGHDQNRASCKIRFVFLCTLWLPTISQSSDRGGSVDCVCVPVNRIISMYVCKSLLVSMILHSLAGTVEIVDWRAQGQDCSHRERGQSSFDMSLAWWKGCHRNHVQGDPGALGFHLREGRSCWQRFCIFVQPRW